jgi:hypothetical protein
MPTRRDIIHLVRVPDQFINQRGGIDQPASKKEIKKRENNKTTDAYARRTNVTHLPAKTHAPVAESVMNGVTHTYIYVINITQATDTLEDGSEAGRKLFLLSQLFGVG